ncbi:lysophospholipid acyltransferase family protein [Caldisalinibacter kiritimatiensis]|uniref:1-acyl-sn-glycerol-3-phosphate acyltransferase n=1 Tax=Caldisalinibacter kiritimatiensis TaxID=1304284 RepID=R1CEK5_9FIRM|nr:lysophospholipid acyltransferase family protein [Caldisalinibacter kiritimatiensis]EOD00730.1 1-acyl-sn-glycerol-3-phosphate acyltransferase [Caldisalinibacter kiritimatiensis]
MTKKTRKTSKTFYNFLQLTLGTYLKKSHNIKADTKDIDNLKPPFLLLGNHTNFWDPFYMGIYIDEPVYYVTSDAHFRIRSLRFLLKLIGAIPKTKFLSDLRTVKEIIRVKKNKGIVGIFPEGKRNWDGKTEKILYPTAKLVKMLKIPVVVSLMKGAHLAKPRWAKHSRKGEIFISYKKILTPEEISSLSTDEIYEKLCQALAHDEYEYQKKHMIPFKGKKLAENLELFIFTCPHCKTIGSLKSDDNKFYCTSCGYTTYYNEYGFLDKGSEEFYFNNTRDWNEWQLKNLESIIYNSKDNLEENILQDKKVTLFKGRGLKPLKKFSIGDININHKTFNFISSLGDKLTFELDKINGANVQLNYKLEFYYEKTLYRFIFDDSSVSAYKWVKALEILKKKAEVSKNIPKTTVS